MPLADELLRFAGAFNDEAVGLQTPEGLVQITRTQLREAAAQLQRGYGAYLDLEELRSQVVNGGSAEDSEIVRRLEDYLEQLENEQEFIDPRLRDVLGQSFVEAHDPGLVELVTGALQAIGVDATVDTAVAMLDVISAYVDGQEGGAHRVPEDQQLVQQAPPAADVLVGLAEQLRGGAVTGTQAQVRQPASPAQAAGFRPPQRRPARTVAPVAVNPAVRAAPLFPPGGLPVPANPGPLKAVTAEELFGLQRGAGGRYDAGENLRTNGAV